MKVLLQSVSDETNKKQRKYVVKGKLFLIDTDHSLRILTNVK